MVCALIASQIAPQRALHVHTSKPHKSLNHLERNSWANSKCEVQNANILLSGHGPGHPQKLITGQTIPKLISFVPTTLQTAQLTKSSAPCLCCNCHSMTSHTKWLKLTCANRQNWKQTTQSLLMNLCLASNTHVYGNLTNLAPGTRSGTPSNEHNWPNRTKTRFMSQAPFNRTTD